MSERKIKDVAASVHQRLLNKAHSEVRPFQELLQYFAMERFLYRLSVSEHRSKFILKGALSLVAVKAPRTRPTRDIDMKGEMSNDVDDVVAVVKKVCVVEVVSDGIDFEVDTVTGNIIDDHDEYSGIRVRFKGYLGNAEIPMQLDIGFGDSIVAEPTEIDYPVLLDFPRFKLRTYPLESTIAEKFEAMVSLGEVNSRMKDFYDIWYLSQNFDFEGRMLQLSIQSTFTTRSTNLPKKLDTFLARLKNPDKTKQWTAFIKRTDIADCPNEFSDVLTIISDFLLPVISHIVTGIQLHTKWIAHKGWIGKTK